MNSHKRKGDGLSHEFLEKNINGLGCLFNLGRYKEGNYQLGVLSVVKNL